MTIPALLYLPPWSVNYSYDILPGVTRTVTSGKTRQRKNSHRRTVIASVTRRLRKSELPYFEAFIRSVCSDGQSKFTDSFADHNGTQQGTVRIVGGEYSVTTDLNDHLVSCELEIFR